MLSRQQIGLTYFVTFWINAFVDTQGISKTFSPREIITRRGLDWNKHARALFGQYIQAHEDRDVTNTMAPRTFPALYLGPTDNIQGTVKAFHLETGQVHKVRNFTRLHMPEFVIRKAELWGKKAKQDDLKNKIEFLNRNREKFDWDTDEEPDEGLVELPFTHKDVPAEEPGVPLESEMDSDTDAVVDKIRPVSEQAQAALANDGAYQVLRDESAGVRTEVDLTDIDDSRREVAQEWNGKVETVSEDEDDDDDVVSTAHTVPTSNEWQDNVRRPYHPPIPPSNQWRNIQYASHSPKARYPRRERVPTSQPYIPTMDNRSYPMGYANVNVSPGYVDKMKMDPNEAREHVMGVALSHVFGLKAGLKEFGQKGEKTYPKNWHNYKTWTPTYRSIHQH